VQKDRVYPPHRVFNVDETGLTTVQSKSSKVFALKGRRQVGSLTTAERGVLSTFVICMSAGGVFVPLMVIFPRQRMKPELADGAPPGTMFSVHKSGWMQTDLFTAWFEHFLSFVRPTRDDPVLLILDGDSTHTKNVNFLERAKEMHTTVICLPPLCSHKLQPLDVSFMQPLNTFFVQAIEKFLRNNPGRSVTQFQMSPLFAEAYLKASTPSTAINGFRACGIVPLDPSVFGDVDFAPAEVTDQPGTSSITDQPGTSSITDQPGTSSIIDQPGTSSITDQPGTSSITEQPVITTHHDTSNNSSYSVSPANLMPIPKATQDRRTNRKRGTSAVLTSTPYRLALKEAKSFFTSLDPPVD
jgi:DDE superfamily endonuclease.